MILQEEPHITVGIQHGKSVDFRLCGVFTTPEGRLFPPGEYRVDISTGKRGFVLGTEYYEDLRLVPLSSETLFDLPHVTIGVDFHWQRQECQTFCGILHLVCDRGGNLCDQRSARRRLPYQCHIFGNECDIFSRVIESPCCGFPQLVVGATASF